MTARRTLPALALVALVLGACAGDPTSQGETTTTGPVVSTPATSTSTTMPDTTPPSADPDLAALTAAEARWAEAGLDTYSYTYRRSCECDESAAGPNTVLVTDGAVVEVRMDRQFEAGFPPGAVAPPGDTIPDLFGLIRASIERGEEIDVTYDERLGHPLTLRLDLASIPVDGGLAMEVLGFDGQEEARAALAEARERWAQAGPADYTYVYRAQCFCIPSAIEVTVAGGEIQSHEVLEGELFGELISIDDVFAYIEDSLDQHPASIDVTYDEEFGYPRSVFVDFDEMMADEEFGYSVELTG